VKQDSTTFRICEEYDPRSEEVSGFVWQASYFVPQPSVVVEEKEEKEQRQPH
jgi:hypothetical protein